MLRILLSGACGRMGGQVSDLAGQQNAVIAAGVDVHPETTRPYPVYPAFSFVQEKADVIVDFSRPEGLKALLEYAVSRKIPCVLGATGYQEKELAAISEAAKSIPIFRSANMSLGVYVLQTLAKQAKALLPDFDIEIVERHHNQKIDAPSGTAVMLYNAVKSQETQPVYGREGRTQKRQKNEIGIHAIRGGTVAGEHEIGFYGPGETLRIEHQAQDRSIFALGALRAARFIAAQTPGEYDMNDLARAMMHS